MPQQRPASKIFRSPASMIAVLAFVAAVATLGSGCAPQIGDACETDNDCPDEGGVVCDTSVRDGMCTVRDCRTGECPSESVCVEFDSHQSFCMRSCNSDQECRSDHVCRDGDDSTPQYCFVEP